MASSTRSAASTAPDATVICNPWTRPATFSHELPGDRQPFLARPSAPPRRIACDPDTASGTLTPGTSLAMNSACRRLSSGMIPASTGIRTRSMRSRNCTHRRHVEHGLRDRELGARLDLVLEAPDLLIEIERAGVGGHADVEGGRPARWPGRRCRARGSAARPGSSGRSSRPRTPPSRRGNRRRAADRRSRAAGCARPSRARRAGPTACRSCCGRGRRSEGSFRRRPAAAP